MNDFKLSNFFNMSIYCIIFMQRKYSEVVNYMPNFATNEFRRSNREVNNNQKHSPVEVYRPSHSPSIYPTPQYTPNLTPNQVIVDMGTHRNSSYESNERRSLPNFQGKMQVPESLNSPMMDPRDSINNGIRSNGLMEQNQLPRRPTQPNLSSEPVQQFTSPQNLRVNPIDLTKFSEPNKRNLMTTNTSPNKLQPYVMNSNGNPNMYFKIPNQPPYNRIPPPPLNTRQGAKVYQSMIFPENVLSQNYNNKPNQSINTSLPLRNVHSSTSELQSTFSSENLYNMAQVPSPMLSDQGNKPRKPTMPQSYRKNQQVWKSMQMTTLKNYNLQSTPQLNAPQSVTSLDLIKQKQQIYNKDKIKLVEPYRFQQKDKRVASQLKNEQQIQDLSKQMQFKFRKKNDFNTASSSVVDLKQLVKPRESVTKIRFTIDNFQVIEKLGKGAYGDVFLARQKQTKFLCVLKSLSKKKIKQLNLQQLVFRQIKIQSYLNHKHITGLYGVFDDQTKIYLIMECMPDGNMASNGKKKITESQTAHLIHQVLDGLNYMHREDIIHRDIKPENLLLNNNYLKIGDFGCAVFGNALRRTVVGCYSYISPQQFSNNPYDQKIDAWSVGILAFQLLTGKPPFDQKLKKLAVQNHNEPHNQQENPAKLQFSDLTFPKQIKLSTDAIDFIKRLLDPDPATRADIKQALKHKFMTKAKQYEKYLESKL